MTIKSCTPSKSRHVNRKEGGREMMSIEKCVRIVDCTCSDYIKITCMDGDTILNTFVKDKTAAEPTK